MADDAPTTDAAPATDAPVTDDAPLEPAGQKALEAFKERARAAERESKAHQAELDKMRAELDEVRAGQLSEHEKEVEKARKEADQAARAEVSSAYQARLDAADIRLAASKFADPEDAILNLDTSGLARDESGNLDQKALTGALDGILKKKPHLAGGLTNGSADGGLLGDGVHAPTREEQLAAARKAGDVKAQLRLTTEQLADLATQ